MLDPYEFVLIPLITGLVTVATGLGMAKKFNPVLSIVLGILGGVFYLFPESPKDGILYGIAFGLSSVGLYSGAKNIKEGVKHG
jgi:hypothetical protein